MPLTLKVGEVIGRGAFATVSDAEECSGIYAAIKKSRVSLRVKRTMLRHEARVLQLLQSHPAIPTLFGYQRLPHFEYIAVDLLGENMRRICKPGYSLKIGTVACIAEQMLSALEHLNVHRIIHRDIKPEHILLHLSDPSRVCLVDFGIARKLTATETLSEPIQRYNPIESNRNVVGTLSWCSIKAQLGYDLRPYDDMESLAYSLLYLLMGDLPWRISVRHDLTKNVMLCVLGVKKAFTIPAAIPNEFRDLLEFARMSKGDITDGLAEMRVKMKTLALNISEIENNLLDFTLEEAVFIQGKLELDAGSNSDDGSTEEPNEEYSNSYWGVDLDRWDTQSVRDKSLTLSPDEVGTLDGEIPEIVVIDHDWTIRPRAAARCSPSRS